MRRILLLDTKSILLLVAAAVVTALMMVASAAPASAVNGNDDNDRQFQDVTVRQYQQGGDGGTQTIGNQHATATGPNADQGSFFSNFVDLLW